MKRSKIGYMILVGVLVVCGALALIGYKRASARPTYPPITLNQAPVIIEAKTLYRCGARTKTGGECQNLVRHAGELCWRHR